MTGEEHADGGADDPPDLDREALAALHDHLAATAERPVERRANQWLGEAEAVAEDALAISDPAVVRERVGKVADLLSNVEGTGDERADEHVRQARELATTLATPGDA